MMDAETLIDTLKQSPQIAVVALVLLFYKKIKEYDKHLETCQEVPKVLIQSQLVAIAEQLTVLHTRITAHRQETKEEIKELKADLKEDIKRVEDRQN